MKEVYKYSVIVPVYNEEESLKNCYTSLSSVMQSTNENYELIFVNDGSKDSSLQILKQIASEDENVKVISLSRNFGQQSALLAGFKNASGDAVINIDADLQDPPEVILQMISKFKEGYDIVLGKRKSRKGENALKKLTAKIYAKILNWLTKNNVPEDIGDFRLVSKKVNQAIISMPEHNRFLRGITGYVGFKQTFVEFNRNERKNGKTKYSIKKLQDLAINGIVSNSLFPLDVVLFGAFTLFNISGILGFVLLLVALISHINFSFEVWMLPVYISLVGLIILAIAIVGIYVGKIFIEVQNRPNYIIDEKINFKK